MQEWWGANQCGGERTTNAVRPAKQTPPSNKCKPVHDRYWLQKGAGLPGQTVHQRPLNASSRYKPGGRSPNAQKRNTAASNADAEQRPNRRGNTPLRLDCFHLDLRLPRLIVWPVSPARQYNRSANRGAKLVKTEFERASDDARDDVSD